jgi:hypothetical protein
VLVVLLGVYVGGYFWLSDQGIVNSSHKSYTVRSYSSGWLAIAFKPAAWIEVTMTGRGVYVGRFQNSPVPSQVPRIVRTYVLD